MYYYLRNNKTKKKRGDKLQNIVSFNNEEFGKLRILDVDGDPWFVGKDVADALGYGNTRDALYKHVDREDKNTVAIRDGIKGNPNQVIINESGLYSLILSSKLDSAKRFKHWVTSEVLPSIRKNGGYIAGQEKMEDDELLAKALLVAQNKIAEREKKIAEQNQDIERMKPKEVFADAVEASETSILIGDMAKLICQNGHKIGQNRLFEWLRENGYLIKYGFSRNLQTQRAMEQKWFEIKERTVVNPDGSVRITKTTMVTGKGQIHFINKFAEMQT